MKNFSRFIFACFIAGLIVGCQEAAFSDVEVILFDPNTISAIQSTTDTSFVEHVGSVNIFERHIYLNRKNGVEWRISKDASGNVLAVVQMENGKIVDVKEYFPNGQLCGLLPAKTNGKTTGDVKYFHPNGRVKTYGYMKNSLCAGEWRIFDENGKMTAIEQYKAEGSLQPINVTTIK